MHHNVFLTIPSLSLLYFCLAKARRDICTWLVYYSMHEARIIPFHEANISKTLNGNELSVPPDNIEVHRLAESDGRYMVGELR